MSYREKSLEEIIRELNLNREDIDGENVETPQEIESAEKESTIKRIAKALRLLDGIVDVNKLADIVIKYVKIEELIREVERVDPDIAFLLKIVLEKNNV